MRDPKNSTPGDGNMKIFGRRLGCMENQQYIIKTLPGLRLYPRVGQAWYPEYSAYNNASRYEIAECAKAFLLSFYCLPSHKLKRFRPDSGSFRRGHAHLGAIEI